MAKQWERVAENLVRHKESGGLYLRAKVGGKIIRKALGVKEVRIGKLKRDTLLAELRARAGSMPTGKAPTVSEVLALTSAWYESRPVSEQKASSLHYRIQIIEVLERTFKKTSPSLWTRGDLETWWTSAGVTRYSSPRKNGMLDTVRKMFDLMIERGLRGDDPSARLKRVKVIQEEKTLPSSEDFQRVLNDIKSQNSDHAIESRNFVAFLAYSGLRIGEARAVIWQDVRKDEIVVSGGDLGTKNREARRVPIIEPMKELLDSMRTKESSGPLFSIKSPRFAISGACRRLKLDHFTPHTFRHLFSTSCIELGVDIPTVAKWLGHKDGGALLMKTYSHLRDEHSQAQAAKVKF